MRNITAALGTMNFRCRRFGCLNPLVVLRAMRDVVRRKRLAEPLPPTAHLFGFTFTSFAGPAAVAFLLQTLIVFASNAGLLGGKSNKDISDKYKTLVTPAGWAFSIWGLIYLLEMAAICFVAYTPASHVFADFTAPWLVANALQATWALAFAHEKLGVAAVLLTGIAAAMCECVRVLTCGDAEMSDRLFVLLPVALHAGWVCAAALVSWNVAAVGMGASIPAQVSLAFISLHAGLLLALASLALPLCAKPTSMVPEPFALAIAWALFAIGREVDTQGDLKVEWQLRRALAHTAKASAGLICGAVMALQLRSCTAPPSVPTAYG